MMHQPFPLDEEDSLVSEVSIWPTKPAPLPQPEVTDDSLTIFVAALAIGICVGWLLRGGNG